MIALICIGVFKIVKAAGRLIWYILFTAPVKLIGGAIRAVRGDK